MNKQETLEEAAERYRFFWLNNKTTINQVFIDGAKFQQEQDKNKYSEEEVLEILKLSRDSIAKDVYVIDWFEQFKKK
jgi:hypothetical protein